MIKEEKAIENRYSTKVSLPSNIPILIGFI